MDTQILTLILTFCCSILVEGLLAENFYEDSRTYYGGRILNGQNVDPEDYPFLVQLQRGKKDLCAGSVISDRYILTAAYCVYEDRCMQTKIFPLSSVQRNIHEIHIEQCVSYMLYHPPTFEHDIALIRSVERLRHSLKLGAIPLPRRRQIFAPNAEGYIIGWGKTENADLPGRVRRGDVKVQRHQECNYEYRNAAGCLGGGSCPVIEITPMSICTIGKNHNRPAGACDGDIGGPLIINGVLAGIINGAITQNGRCKVGSATLHTSVPDFVAWIVFISDL